jgi:ABC-type lipoprotein release transport system permease subunit
MKDYQLAWRNLWRNKRRTLITAASVFFAIFFALVMRSFQLGAYDKLFKDVIESYTGYIQLQHKDYFDEPILDNSFSVNPTLLDKMAKDPNVSAIIPRLESYALAASGSRTQGVIVIGMDPEGEDRVLNMKKRMVRYKLTPDAVSAITSENISDRLRKALGVFSGEAFTSDEVMTSILGIEDEDTFSVMPLMRKYASFNNAYLADDDTCCAMIGNGLSEYLKVGVGDTIVLMGQGYHGTTAAGKYKVKGVVRLPAPDIDNILVYLPLPLAQELYAAEGMSTSAIFSLKSNDENDVEKTAERLNQLKTGEQAIHTWKELNALLVNQMEADNKSGMIMIAILYLVIAFGVFGTVLMMMSERRREFGMVVSIGMQKLKLAKIVSLEMLLIGLIGVVSGVIASLPVVFYGNIHPLRFTGQMAQMYEDYGFEPVMPTMLPDMFYLWQIVVVLVILAIAIVFSIRKIFKINVINALRA